nr:MAG TPA: hypothetical protein [Caudoviricetes sp.]DAI69083.1 MAG TPA: hypothetical protein [Caudoviricetes sp.]DAI99142.1 MAG TPA: hypothetical protein [Caudoviricetes sp.]
MVTSTYSLIIETLSTGGVFAFRRYDRGIREMHPCHVVVKY